MFVWMFQRWWLQTSCVVKVPESHTFCRREGRDSCGKRTWTRTGQQEKIPQLMNHSILYRKIKWRNLKTKYRYQNTQWFSPSQRTGAVWLARNGLFEKDSSVCGFWQGSRHAQNQNLRTKMCWEVRSYIFSSPYILARVFSRARA